MFIILMLIFILQSVWLYISELAGKDLEIDVVLKFLLYVSPRLIVLVLPLTILLSSIMVFGNFAENYEFAAMKSTGISLQRAMRSLAIFIVGLAITTFFFSNNVIPYAEYNFYNLRKNLQKKKPAMAIAEGQFNDIGAINIKVEEKSGDRGQYLKDVTIHQKKNKSNENLSVIKSKTGELVSSEDSNVLQLVLYDGNSYEELKPKDVKERRKRPHVKSTFDKYTINIDLAKLDNVDLDKKNFSTKHTMLNVKNLNYTIDTLVNEKKKRFDDLSTNLYNRSTASTLHLNIEPKEVDTVFNGNSIYDLFQARKSSQISSAALNSVNSTLSILNTKKRSFAVSEKKLNKHIMAFHDKFALGFACIILFFVGAPLGALIKKGGLGLPIVIAIVLFLTYHFIGIFAKNSAEDSSLNPILASWLSTLIMLPLSIYLTTRATKDRGLFEFSGLFSSFKKLINTKIDQEEINTNVLLRESKDYKALERYSNDKLIDIVKNYRQYDFDKSFKNTSLEILNDRGLSEEELRFGGNLTNSNFENALRYKSEFRGNSIFAFKLYVISIFGDIVGAVLKNNGFPNIGMALLIIGLIISVVYTIYLIKSLVSLSNFYKQTPMKKTNNFLVLLLIGLPLYFLVYFFYKDKLDEDIKSIR